MTIQLLEDADHREVNVDAQTIGTCNGKDGLLLVARRAARAALAAPTVPCGSARRTREKQRRGAPERQG
jgi:hypothetical protein